MGGKKKGGKRKKKGKKEEPEPEDEFMKLDGATLEKTMAALKEKLTDSKIKRNLIQIEKDMIHDFYNNTRQEVKEIESEVKNFDTKMQDLEEHHKVEIKVYMQKVKHLEYEHQNQCKNVELDAKIQMNKERDFHVDKEKDMRKDKGNQKQEYERDEMQNIGEVEDREKELDDINAQLRVQLDGQKKILIEKYEHKLDDLREELELRLKVEIHEIEERKNQHINDLMKNHEEAFREMKEYYNDITRENLELIKMHKEKLVDIRAQIESNQQIVDRLKVKMEEFEKPLIKARHNRDILRKQLATFDKDKMALRNAKARLLVLKKKVKDIKTERKELEEKFLKVEKEKEDMYRKYEVAIE